MEVPDSLQNIIDIIREIVSTTLFQIKDYPVTIGSIIKFVVIIVVFIIISKFFNRHVLRRILSRFDIEKAVQYNMLRVSHYIISVIAVIVALESIGFDMTGLAVILGMLSVGIGFGLQNITSNFISGIILLFERPINVGDRVTVGDIIGRVAEINMRATTIKSLNNISIIVPNSDFISKTVTNWSHGDTKIRLDIEVGVSYDSDLDEVLKVLKTIADEHPKVLKQPKPSVLLRSFGDSSWDMMLRAWIENPEDYYLIISDINCEIVRKFRENDITIPYPQRDLHFISNFQKDDEKGED